MWKEIIISKNISANSLCYLDPDALRQITSNLISNVEKYAFLGRYIEINAELKTNKLTLSIIDQGPGIPVEKKDTIFMPFERVTDTTKEGSSGTGLGLTIARELAICMGGMLSLKKSATGATFELQVPAPPHAHPKNN